ncbi:TOBE domain-containing protein [Blastococcus brunescens]|uniref:TOBE domain-containing protein n=1 Tax=Blastococcus brunescens TaxID=1564165 RepID=UPI003BEEB29F
MPGTPISVAVRPEDVQVSEVTGPDHVRARLVASTFVGSHFVHTLYHAGVTFHAHGRNRIDADVVSVLLPGNCWFFPGNRRRIQPSRRTKKRIRLLERKTS